MPKHSSKNSSFALPRRVKRKPPTDGEAVANKAKKEQAREKEAAAKAAKEKRLAEEAARGPSKKQLKRLTRRQKMLEEGKMEQTDKDVGELTKLEHGVEVALVDVQDEAELRNKFHSQGTAGKESLYFSASRYKFKFLLAKDGTPVAQIIKWP
eukprot:gb/GFBE01027966.1/.p1 GENE.gb/GFBE01027966.1/~~gb/GFBE01027966.1/.p1  ORF type:complete len:153 (+),score=48.78 gb/GFBE01027966.1/:1-459(+)